MNTNLKNFNRIADSGKRCAWRRAVKIYPFKPVLPMSSAFAAPFSFELKSAQWPLLALCLHSSDWRALERDWQQRYGGQDDFFDHDALLLDFSTLEKQAGSLDLPSLLALLRRWHLQPLAYRGGAPLLRQQAAAAGLALADEATPITKKLHTVPPQTTASTPPTPSPNPGALLIDRPLRSGQQVYARGRDLIVTAIVNPGAEVVADGHIHVYAPLRGKAIAGARGNEQARIFTHSLQAELLSIAGIYRTSEQPLPEAVQGKAAQVRLERNPQGERLLIDMIN